MALELPKSISIFNATSVSDVHVSGTKRIWEASLESQIGVSPFQALQGCLEVPRVPEASSAVHIEIALAIEAAWETEKSG